MRRMTVAAAGLAALALGACSSGGDGDDSSLPQRSFVEMGDQFSDLDGEINALDFTDPATLPTSGSADYDGVMNVQTTTGLLARGDMELEVDFGDPADPLDGEAYNFRTDLDAEVDGSLQIGNGSIDRDVDVNVDFTLAFDVDGTLTADGTSHAIDATGAGDFFGTEPDFIAGFADGPVDSDGVIGVADIAFIGER